MATHPLSRKRYASQPTVAVGGLSRIIQGVFGMGSPVAGHASEQARQTAAHRGGAYYVHEGDIFTPGAMNWVVDPTHDGPLMTAWGHAFLRTPNTFSPYQAAQLYTAAAAALYGVGGQVAGQVITQPLSDNQEVAGG